MAKFVVAKNMSIGIQQIPTRMAVLINVGVDLKVPVEYTLGDIVNIIKLYTGYTGNLGWRFENAYEPDKNFECEDGDVRLDEIKYSRYKHLTPHIICFYGSLRMKIGVRGHKKYTKSYPSDCYLAWGTFPTETEILQGIYEKDHGIKKSESERKEFEEKLKAYFKPRYKITNDIVKGYYGEENALIRK